MIRDQLLASIRVDLRAHVKREPAGNELLDEVRQWVDTCTIEDKTRDRLQMLRLANNRLTYKNNTSQPVNQQMIDAAKEYPIEEIYAAHVHHPIVHGMAKCPLHEDKTASFSMKKHNRYKCFGCSAQGSSIDLYMKLNNVDFINAVKALQ